MAVVRTILAVLIATTFCNGQSASPWRFWDSLDGFVESYTGSAAVSPSGGVWAKHGRLGNIEFLNGYTAPHFPDPNSSGQLECAPDGTLWMWSGKGLSRFEDGEWTSFYMDEIVRAGSIRGNSGEGWNFASFANPFLQSSIQVVALDRSHALVLLADRVVEFDAPHAASRIILSHRDAGLRRLTGMRRGRDGNIYVTGYGGLGRLEGGAGQVWRWQALPLPPKEYVEFDWPISVRPQELFVAGIKSNLLADALRFDDRHWEKLYAGQSRVLRAWPGIESSVWVQDGNHIVELAGGREKPVDRSGALSGIVLAVMVEEPGRFWVAGSQGLSRYAPLLWRAPAEAPPLDDVVNSIAEDKDGNIWFLAASQLIRFDNKTWSRFPLPKGETPLAIFTEGLAALPDGRIAVGTSSPHLLIFDPRQGTFEAVRHPLGRATRLFVKQRDGTLLVEVYPPEDSKNVAIESFDGHAFRTFIGSDVMGAMSDLRSIVATPDGNVWVGGTASFGVFNRSGLRVINASDGFTDPGAYFIFRDPSGRMFAGGRDGLFRQEGGKWKRIQPGLDRVRSVIAARDGSVWIASGSGVHRYRDGEWISQGIEEGLPSSVAYKVFEDSRGRIWAGTTRGLSLFHPEADPDPPTVSLADDHNPTEAPPGGQLRLGFSGVDKWKFTPPGRLLFSYRLDGQDWSRFSGANSASFDKLEGGRHRFEVRAMDRNGNVSAVPAVHLFSVLSLWYKTPQFILLATGAAAVIVILFILASSSYLHRGTLIQSLNQKNKLERDRQNVLERIARREPLPSILGQIVSSLAEHCPAAVSLLAWAGDTGIQICSCPLLPERAQRTVEQARIPDGANIAWWRLLLFEADTFADYSPILEVRSGERESLGAIALLFPPEALIPATSQWLLETFCGLAAAAIENAHLYERLAHQARHDVLTELPNRLCFDDKLQTCVTAARETGQPLAILYLDLDRFKQINDTLGHRIGDLFLREVAQRLSGALRGRATLARIGGDEFTVLLEHNADKSSARQLAERLLASLRAPIVVEEQELFASASIGISLFPDDGGTPTTLQKNADIAMYRAKAKGKNCMEFFSAEMGSKTTAAVNIEQVLRKALDENGFELFYQPQFTPEGKPGGMEALLRLRHSGGDYLSPGEFIAVAEDSGLIVPIGTWVLREACRQMRQWLDDGVPATRISVNVSALEIARDSFAWDVAEILSETRLPPGLLELELTESAIVRNLGESTIQMQKLRATGVRLAIDDFGTGYSSFAQLQRLPLDTLKIDRSFVMNLTGAARSPLIESIVALGKSLGLSIVAEGVETEQQLAVIRESGCDLVQGYLFSRPVPAAEARMFLSRENYFAPQTEEVYS